MKHTFQIQIFQWRLTGWLGGMIQMVIVEAIHDATQRNLHGLCSHNSCRTSKVLAHETDMTDMTDMAMML